MKTQKMNEDWDKIRNLALIEIHTIITELPEPLREKAEIIPVTLEKTPSRELQLDGIESDTLGLFTGAEFADGGAVVIPPQIVMFLENLWGFAGSEEKSYRAEVRTTFLHELGHYFGLDENDLMERGLE
jgi:predicted Zn-dependent protease with MMP-like domain